MQDKSDESGLRAASWFRTHKKLVIILSIVGVLLIGGGVATGLYFMLRTPPEPTPAITEPEPEPEPVIYYSQLTGLEVPSEDAANQAVTAVMIENSLEARPQSGLKESGVVFEATTEGGITRFLAIYQQEKPALIGPVRSVRPHFIDWVAAFDASIGHVGGSYQALQEIRSGRYKDLDQFFNPGTYWRATDRFAPHNVYTNFSRLDEWNKQKKYTKSEFTGFSRHDSEAAETPTATSISVTVSGPLFNSAYTYNANTNSYDRSQGGAAHMDREKGRISPRVVVIMKVPVSGNQVTAVGSGNAYIFQDGTVTQGKWNKASKTAQLKFTTTEGEDIPLARGQTWLTAISNSTGSVTWK